VFDTIHSPLQKMSYSDTLKIPGILPFIVGVP